MTNASFVINIILFKYNLFFHFNIDIKRYVKLTINKHDVLFCKSYQTQSPTKIVLSLSPQFLAKQLIEQPATSNCTNESTVMPAVLSIFLVFFTLVLFFLTSFYKEQSLRHV